MIVFFFSGWQPNFLRVQLYFFTRETKKAKGFIKRKNMKSVHEKKGRSLCGNKRQNCFVRKKSKLFIVSRKREKWFVKKKAKAA